MSSRLPEECAADFVAHALRTWPVECAGYVLGGKYIELEPVSSSKGHVEVVPPDEYDVFCHSHTDMALGHLSDADMHFRELEGRPFAVVATDGTNSTEIEVI